MIEPPPKPLPAHKSREQILGRQIGMSICAVMGLAVALGPGVERGQRLLGFIFFLACGAPVLWKMLRRPRVHPPGK